MSMPWTFDALLPDHQRYTSLKFRRVAHRFLAHKLDYADAAELVAFVRTIGLKHAITIFRWKAAGQREIDRLLKHLSDDANVERMVQENHDRTTRADGLGCLQAMKDGGWTKGAVPRCVRMALLDMRAAGIARHHIGEQVGLTLDQVRTICHGYRTRRAVPLVGLVAQ